MESVPAFVRQHRQVDDMVAMVMSGSMAYNLDTGRSDEDFVAVYLGTLPSLLGLDLETAHRTLTNEKPLGVATAYSKTKEDEPDIMVYELKRFVELLCEANWRATEILLSVHDEERHATCLTATQLGSIPHWCSPVWRELIDVALNQCNLVCQQLVRQQLDYVAGRVSKCKKVLAKCKTDEEIWDRLPGKRTYHMARLLFEAKRIALHGQPPQVFLTDAEELDYLRKVKANKIPLTQQLCDVDQWVQEIEKAIAVNPAGLAVHVDAGKLNRWLKSVRRKQLAQHLK